MAEVFIEQPWIHRTCYIEGVGPVDNRPFTNKLHLFVLKQKHQQKCDTCHVTCDMLWEVNIISKVQLPSSYGL